MVFTTRILLLGALLLLVACERTPRDASRIEGVYVLNRTIGHDTLILETNGRYRHSWEIDKAAVVDTGHWSLTREEGAPVLVLSNFFEWWGLTGDPDGARAAGERSYESQLPISERHKDQLLLNLNRDIGLRYEQTAASGERRPATAR